MYPTWSECRKAPHKINKLKLNEQLSGALDVCFPNQNWKKGRSDRKRSQIQSLLDRVLKANYGSWIQCWCYSAGDGGLVQHWCCSSHSVWRKDDHSIVDTINRVGVAVEEWVNCIHKIEDMFCVLDKEHEGKPTELKIERAASTIVRYVIEINSARDSWYYTFQRVFMWYLEHIEIKHEWMEDIIESIVEGHFSSWIAPTENSISEAASKLGELSGRENEDEMPLEVDTTNAWCQLRKIGYSHQRKGFAARVTAISDAHANFVSRRDFPRSKNRGEAMLRALEQCRRDATKGVPLNWQVLRDWQAIVLQLENPPEFRTQDAFAKNGRERYPIRPGTFKQFKKCLEDVNDNECCPILKATFVYFDICFFHPFGDGNARSARLALEYVLTLHGFSLLLPDPIFRLPVSPNDYWDFEITLRSLVGIHPRKSLQEN